MGVIVVTGSASGMGAAAAVRLRADGHDVIGVDLHDADILADLSSPEGRVVAAEQALAHAGGRLDGAVLAAGLGPSAGSSAHRIVQVNYAGVVDLLTAWRPALAAADRAKVVVFGSNSTTTAPLVPRGLVTALLAHDLERAVRVARRRGRLAPVFAYAGSKLALTRWVRRSAVTEDWAGAGIRLNAIAPGAVSTPLLARQLDSPAERAQIEAFPLPIGHFGDPDEIARWVALMCSDAANSLCGSVVVVDGGSEAYFRADDWPVPVPLRGLARYLRRSRAWRRRDGPRARPA
ncbi:MAG TPA: SDR family oxidoreductase [Microbacteriaceae bacterium]|nr:SDR family oxidoreductase [Microbacteriaceae bacterium]